MPKDDITQTGPYFDLFSFPSAGQSGGVPSGTEAYYSLDYANVHVIVLDSEGPSGGPGGTPGKPLPTDPMMVWLVADLQATTADWVIAIWHRSAYSKGLLHDSDTEVNEKNMRENVLPTLESYGVDLVLTGHSHNYERSYLLDGHYGLSTSLTPANLLDSGDGDPAGDGAYRKTSLGPASHEGEVHAVCGSSSEVRMTTLEHPAQGDLQYKDKLLAYNGFHKAEIKFGKPQIKFRGKGAGLDVPALPLTTPVTAQLLQLDTGSCWETVFPTAKTNDATTFSAVVP